MTSKCMLEGFVNFAENFSYLKIENDVIFFGEKLILSKQVNY